MPARIVDEITRLESEKNHLLEDKVRILEKLQAEKHTETKLKLQIRREELLSNHLNHIDYITETLFTKDCTHNTHECKKDYCKYLWDYYMLLLDDFTRLKTNLSERIELIVKATLEGQRVSICCLNLVCDCPNNDSYRVVDSTI